MSFILELLHVLPKNLLSSATGALSAIRFPPAINRLILSWFTKRYRVNLAEAEFSLEAYTSLGEFFTRNLKAGVRPIENEIVSPVDGAFSEQGIIEDGRLYQVKGVSYQLGELLADEKLASRFEGGYYLTIYLAPGDYHHVHSPVSGELSEFIAIPGTLWPVNPESVRRISKVFCRNERIISLIQTRDFGTVAVVKVGATNVGSIALAYDSFVSNRSPVARMPIAFLRFLSEIFGYVVTSAKIRAGMIRPETSSKTAKPRKPFMAEMPAELPFSRKYREKITIERGERLATFRMGSTVVLLFEKGKFVPGENCRKEKIQFGQRIGSAEYL